MNILFPWAHWPHQTFFTFNSRFFCNNLLRLFMHQILSINGPSFTMNKSEYIWKKLIDWASFISWEKWEMGGQNRSEHNRILTRQWQQFRRQKTPYRRSKEKETTWEWHGNDMGMKMKVDTKCYSSKLRYTVFPMNLSALTILSSEFIQSTAGI